MRLESHGSHLTLTYKFKLESKVGKMFDFDQELLAKNKRSEQVSDLNQRGQMETLLGNAF